MYLCGVCVCVVCLCVSECVCGACLCACVRVVCVDVEIRKRWIRIVYKKSKVRNKFE